MAYKVLYIPLFVILVVGVVKTNCFFVNNSVISSPSRNVTCSWLLDYQIVLPTLRNFSFTFPVVNDTVMSDNGLCFYLQRNITLRDGSLINITEPSTFDDRYLFAHSIYKQYISARCSSGNFQLSTTPIGYAECTRLPYEMYTTKICVCSTNNCNRDYQSCIASVQASQSSPPSNPPSIIPELTNIISCRNGYQGPTFANYYTGEGWIDTEYTPRNMTAARAYQSTRSVACVLWVNLNTGDWYQFSTMYEEYSTTLTSILLIKTDRRYAPSYAESSTSVAIQYTTYVSNSLQYFFGPVYEQVICICTTNNCNQDLSTCAIGFTANFSMVTNTSTTTTTTTTIVSTSTVSTSTTTTRAVTSSGITGNVNSTTAPTTTTTSKSASSSNFIFFFYENFIGDTRF